MKKHGRLALVFMMAIVMGFLLPQLSVAGSLEPSGSPAPTMKTLDQIPPTWDQTLQCDTTACPRFVLVMGGAGVLDKETGLVWEQSPSTTFIDMLQFAQFHCDNLSTGGRFGWRLPTVQELQSLIDPTRVSLNGVSTLPSGNPFSNVQVNNEYTLYWSATRYPWGGTTSAWAVTFTSGVPWPANANPVTNQNYAWCVRSGQGVDAQ